MRIFPPLRGARWLALAVLAACHHAPAASTSPEPARSTASARTQPPLVAPAPITVIPMVAAPTIIPLLDIPAGTHLGSRELVAMSLLTSGIDVSFAQLAMERTAQRDVLAYARRIVTDHTTLSTQLRDLLAQIDLSARDDDVTRALRERSARQREILAGLSGRAFDSTYMQVEVNYHRQLVDLIDHVLLPSASRGEVREYLTALRPAVSAHLAHAEQVRATLSARR